MSRAGGDPQDAGCHPAVHLAPNHGCRGTDPGSREERPMTRWASLVLGALLALGTMGAAIAVSAPAGAMAPAPVDDVSYGPRCPPNCRCWPDGSVNWCLA